MPEAENDNVDGTFLASLLKLDQIISKSKLLCFSCILLLQPGVTKSLHAEPVLVFRNMTVD